MEERMSRHSRSIGLNKEVLLVHHGEKNSYIMLSLRSVTVEGSWKLMGVTRQDGEEKKICLDNPAEELQNPMEIVPDVFLRLGKFFKFPYRFAVDYPKNSLCVIGDSF
jgi:hypothetical protein